MLKNRLKKYRGSRLFQRFALSSHFIRWRKGFWRSHWNYMFEIKTFGFRQGFHTIYFSREGSVSVKSSLVQLHSEMLLTVKLSFFKRCASGKILVPTLIICKANKKTITAHNLSRSEYSVFATLILHHWLHLRSD